MNLWKFLRSVGTTLVKALCIASLVNLVTVSTSWAPPPSPTTPTPLTSSSPAPSQPAFQPGQLLRPEHLLRLKPEVAPTMPSGPEAPVTTMPVKPRRPVIPLLPPEQKETAKELEKGGTGPIRTDVMPGAPDPQEAAHKRYSEARQRLKIQMWNLIMQGLADKWGVAIGAKERDPESHPLPAWVQGVLQVAPPTAGAGALVAGAPKPVAGALGGVVEAGKIGFETLEVGVEIAGLLKNMTDPTTEEGRKKLLLVVVEEYNFDTNTAFEFVEFVRGLAAKGVVWVPSGKR